MIDWWAFWHNYKWRFCKFRYITLPVCIRITVIITNYKIQKGAAIKASFSKTSFPETAFSSWHAQMWNIYYDDTQELYVYFLLSTQISFFDRNFSVVNLFRCLDGEIKTKWLKYIGGILKKSSPEPLGKFQPYWTQSIQEYIEFMILQ